MLLKTLRMRGPASLMMGIPGLLGASMDGVAAGAVGKAPGKAVGVPTGVEVAVGVGMAVGVGA